MLSFIIMFINAILISLVISTFLFLIGEFIRYIDDLFSNIYITLFLIIFTVVFFVLLVSKAVIFG